MTSVALGKPWSARFRILRWGKIHNRELSVLARKAPQAGGGARGLRATPSLQRALLIRGREIHATSRLPSRSGIERQAEGPASGSAVPVYVHECAVRQGRAVAGAQSTGPRLSRPPGDRQPQRRTLALYGVVRLSGALKAQHNASHLPRRAVSDAALSG